MKKEFFFGIDNQRVGPLDEEKIRKHISEGKITAQTLAWCQGMKDWVAVSQLSELMLIFSKQLEQQMQPPPLPSDTASKGTATPPPLPQGAAAVQTNAPEGLTPLQQSAYRFVCWGFRPWRGRKNIVYDYVQKDPRRALPVAAATLACFAAVIAIGFSNMEQPQQQAQTQGQMQQGPMVMPQPDWQAQHRAWKDAHDYGSSVINDAYKYRRDSQDRMDETYRRGTYDWYTDKDK